MKPHFSHTHCPHLFSTAEIKARTRRNLGRIKFILAYRWRKPKESLKQRPQRSTASWLALVACPLCFLIQPRSTCKDDTTHSGLSCPQQSSIRKMPQRHTHRSVWWIIFSPAYPSSHNNSTLCQADKTNKNNKNLPAHPPKQLWKTCKTKCFTGTQSAIQRPCLGLVRKNICDLMCPFIQHINTILETKT